MYAARDEQNRDETSREEQRKKEWEEKKKRAKERQKEQAEAGEQYVENMSEYASALASAPSTDASYEGGLAFHAKLNLGLGFSDLPVVGGSTTERAEGEVESTNTDLRSGTLDASGDVQLWPIWTKWVCVGGFGRFGGGALMESSYNSTSLSLSGGGMIRLGSPWFSLVGEIGQGWRAGSVSSELVTSEAISTSTGSYGFGLFRYGGGIEFSGQNNFDTWRVGVRYIRETPNLPRKHFTRGPQVAHVFRLNVDILNVISGRIEYAPNYPWTGQLEATDRSSERPTEAKPYFMLQVGKSFDWIVTYESSNNRRRDSASKEPSKKKTNAEVAAGEGPRDRDGDGVPDPDDQCPSEPQYVENSGSSAGCPTSDNDGDGVANREDVCPNLAVESGDDDGCPDRDDDGTGSTGAAATETSGQCPADSQVPCGDGCMPKGASCCESTGAYCPRGQICRDGQCHSSPP